MFWKYKRLFFLLSALMACVGVRAQGSVPAASQPGPMAALSNPFVWTMLIVMVFLLVVIGSLANLLINAARKNWAEQKSGGVPTAAASALLLAMVVFSRPAMAQGAPSVASVTTPIVNGLNDNTFYMIVSVIGVEVLVILYLLFNVNKLLKSDEAAAIEAGVAGRTRPVFHFSQWWARVNKFRPVTEEEGIDTGHDYDGIHELDNKLPPWWKYGFYATIIFAVVYLWRYHVSHSAPLQDEEYTIAVAQAAIQKEAYLKMAANNVDETTVKLLTTPADLEAGKAIFTSTCFACHGKNGEGGVGPNLTDGYWLHGGSIQEVFKTIKYGWPDKGMKSWKDDYSPSQIAQIASYVKSLAGTNPPNAKAPQGTLIK